MACTRGDGGLRLSPPPSGAKHTHHSIRSLPPLPPSPPFLLLDDWRGLASSGPGGFLPPPPLSPPPPSFLPPSSTPHLSSVVSSGHTADARLSVVASHTSQAWPCSRRQAASQPASQPPPPAPHSRTTTALSDTDGLPLHFYFTFTTLH